MKGTRTELFAGPGRTLTFWLKLTNSAPGRIKIFDTRPVAFLFIYFKAICFELLQKGPFYMLHSLLVFVDPFKIFTGQQAVMYNWICIFSLAGGLAQSGAQEKMIFGSKLKYRFCNNINRENVKTKIIISLTFVIFFKMAKCIH